MVEPANNEFESKVQVKVPLVDEYRGLPFALKSRIGIALAFAFMADSEEVSNFMQKASKKTRSYYVNANGLRGFLSPISIIKCIKRAMEQNQIKEVTKHQQIDLDALLKSLDQMQSNAERTEYLSTWCPCLYIFVL